ncbi:MAG: nicotinate (nicotinamide) nucleotide adenylyltransferase [Bacteroidota bacterium]
MTDLLNIILPPGKVSLRIGLFFGSFNPVHIGHLAIANYLVEFGNIDQLWFVVSPQNPHKKKENLLNDYDRLEMMHLAVKSEHRFRVCDVEFRLPKPSYTIDTLAHLSEKYPDHSFSIIMGSDNLVNFHRWKNYDQILRNYGILVYPRPGFDPQQAQIEDNYTLINAPLMEISSTFIREGIRQGRDLRHFLPPGVWDYIDKMGFYRA